MKIRNPRLAGLLAGLSFLTVAVLGGMALAQVPGLFITSPTGLEQIEVFVPSTGTVTTGSQKVQITLNQARNAQGYTLVAAGTTISTQVANTASVLLATGAITTWNVNFATAPYDGLTMSVGCPGGNVTTLTAAATLPAGVTIVGAAVTSCTAATPTFSSWIYAAAANVWYRIE